MPNEKFTKKDIDVMRENYRAKVFRMMLHIAVIFGVPAVIAFWGGGWMDVRFSSGGDTWRVSALGLAFVFSWVLVFRLYNKLNKESKEIEAKAKSVDSTEQVSK